MSLSKRQVQLGLQLLSLTQPTTTSHLAQTLHVSVRTVKSDLKAIRTWLQAMGDYYQAKPRIGIWLAVTPAERQHLRGALLAVSAENQFSTPQERVDQLGLLLATTTDYLTTQQLENRLGISKNTVITDLTKVETYLAAFQVQLERKHYYGYRLRGRELQLRSVLEALLNQMLNVSLTTTLSSLQQLSQLPLTTVPELATIFKVALPLFTTATTDQQAHFDPNDQATMLIRLAIIGLRLSLQCPLNRSQPLTVSATEKAGLPYYCFTQLMQHYDFPWLQAEYAYLLRGANPRFDDHNIAQLTKTIIGQVSQQTGLPFEQDSQLQVNLFSHLLTKLSNKYKFTTDYNPFINDIRERQPQLFTAVTQVLRTTISANPAVVNESFVVFVTLHFLVSLAQHQPPQNARLMYVCSTGLGVTSLIKNELERQLTNIEIAGFAAPNEVAQKLAQWQPDLIVSIFPLPALAVPVIQVSPLPSARDIQRLKAAVAKILNVTTAQLTPVVRLPTATSQLEATRALMVQAAVIYSQLHAWLGPKIPAQYQTAFMIHVMLAVQRSHCQQNYPDHLTRPVSKAGHRIRQLFKAQQLTINATEIQAILQYTHIEDLTQKGVD